jgi:hypothetical protein
MVYFIAYFVVNILFTFKIIHNVYLAPHTPEFREELKEDIDFFIPLTLLFGAILIVVEYILRNLEGE